MASIYETGLDAAAKYDPSLRAGPGAVPPNATAATGPSWAEADLAARRRAGQVAGKFQNWLPGGSNPVSAAGPVSTGPAASAIPGPAPVAPAAAVPQSAGGVVSRGLGAVKSAVSNPMNWVKTGAKGWAAAAPVLGAVQTATNTPEEANAYANKTGLDYNSFGGRVGSTALNWLQNTGNVATFGLAGKLGEGISNVVAGQPFFDPYKPGTVAPAASPAVTAPGSQPDAQGLADTAGSYPPGYEVPGQVATTPTLPPVAPFTSADIDSARVPVSGTGAFRNNTTGVVTNLDTRSVAGPGAVAGPTRRGGIGGSVGRFFGAGKRLAAMARKDAADATAARDQMKYGYANAVHISAIQKDADLSALAAAHLKANPGDIAGAAAIRAGRPGPGGRFTGTPNMAGGIDVLNTRSGGVVRTTPQPKPTENDIAADMKGKKMTREQVLTEYKNRGIDTTGIK